MCKCNQKRIDDELVSNLIIFIESVLLKLFSEMPFEIELEDEKLNKYEYLGLITLDLTLVPRYLKDEKDVRHSINMDIFFLLWMNFVGF